MYIFYNNFYQFSYCLLAVQMFIYYTVLAFLLKLEQLFVKDG